MNRFELGLALALTAFLAPPLLAPTAEPSSAVVRNSASVATTERVDGSAVRAGQRSPESSAVALPRVDGRGGLAGGISLQPARADIVLWRGSPVTQNAPEPPSVTVGSPRTVASAISLSAALYGADAPTMARIAFCESTNRPDAVNPVSGASGLFQFIPTTWTANVARMGAPYTLADRTNPVASSVVAAWMISHGGTGPWDASRSCWG